MNPRMPTSRNTAPTAIAAFWTGEYPRVWVILTDMVVPSLELSRFGTRGGGRQTEKIEAPPPWFPVAAPRGLKLDLAAAADVVTVMAAVAGVTATRTAT